MTASYFTEAETTQHMGYIPSDCISELLLKFFRTLNASGMREVTGRQFSDSGRYQKGVDDSFPHFYDEKERSSLVLSSLGTTLSVYSFIVDLAQYHMCGEVEFIHAHEHQHMHEDTCISIARAQAGQDTLWEHMHHTLCVSWRQIRGYILYIGRSAKLICRQCILEQSCQKYPQSCKRFAYLPRMAPSTGLTCHRRPDWWLQHFCHASEAPIPALLPTYLNPLTIPTRPYS